MEARNRESTDGKPLQRLCKITSIHGYAWVNRIERRPLKFVLLAVVVGFTLILPESAIQGDHGGQGLEFVDFALVLPLSSQFCLC